MRDQSTHLSISIVIASLDRHEHLSACLASINQAIQDAHWIFCEVIIVDQSEELFTPAERYTYPVRVIASAKGASLARNIGLLQATGDYVWFLDDDALVVEFQDFSAKGLEGSPILFAHWLERPCPHKRILDRSLCSKLWLIRISGTPFYLLPRWLAIKAGGFDQELGPGRDLSSGEDLDLLIRTYKLTTKSQANIFVAKLSHPNNKKAASKKKLYARSRGYVLARNAWHTALSVEMLYSLFAALRGDPSRLRWIVEGRQSYYSKQQQ